MTVSLKDIDEQRAVVEEARAAKGVAEASARSSPAAIAAAIAMLSERRPSRIGIFEPCVGGLMHLRRHAG